MAQRSKLTAIHHLILTKASWRIFLLLFFLLNIISCKLFRKKNKSHPIEVESTGKFNQRTIKNIIATARSYYGVPYKTGGTDGRGMDCSGLLITCFSNAGFKLPRVSWQQAEVGEEVNLVDARPGDLVFFVTSKGGGIINHAGMITEVHSQDEILFIHSSSSRGVIEDNLMKNFWKSSFVRVMRPF